MNFNIKEHLKQNYGFYLFYLFLVIIPLLVIKFWLKPEFISFLKNIFVFNVLYFLNLFNIYFIKNKTIIQILKSIFITYYIATYISLAYILFTLKPINYLQEFQQNIFDIFHGLLGILKIYIIIIPIFIVLFIYCYNKVFKQKSRFKESKHLIFTFIVIIITIITILLNGELIFSNLKSNLEDELYRNNQVVFFPKNDFNTNSNENIIILQLESLNSLLVNETITPNFLDISKDGTILKNFYGNSIRTNRAQANILCGINGNFKQAYSYYPEDILNNCLPKLLKNSGYKTIVFRSDTLEFTNTGNFFKEIGFDEIHYENIMQEEDLKYPWGYDDKTFYKRIFEYLNINYKNQNKLFIYIEVSSHHYPFTENDFNYLIYPEPKDFNEEYANSLYNQDSALKNFYSYYKNYTNNSNNSHLFILGDHSWPIGINNNTMNEVGHYEDNFKTSLVFIPKKSSDYIQNGRIIEKRFSEVDLIPTIFSILNKTEYNNSFEPILRNKPLTKYDNCQMMLQTQNDLTINIVKYPNKYTYFLKNKEIYNYNLEIDPYEQNKGLIDQNKNTLEFLELYGCDRYKYFNNYYILTDLNYPD
jgi:hypothetical protein